MGALASQVSHGTGHRNRASCDNLAQAGATDLAIWTNCREAVAEHPAQSKVRVPADGPLRDTRKGHWPTSGPLSPRLTTNSGSPVAQTTPVRPLHGLLQQPPGNRPSYKPSDRASPQQLVHLRHNCTPLRQPHYLEVHRGNRCRTSGTRQPLHADAASALVAGYLLRCGASPATRPLPRRVHLPLQPTRRPALRPALHRLLQQAVATGQVTVDRLIGGSDGKRRAEPGAASRPHGALAQSGLARGAT